MLCDLFTYCRFYKLPWLHRYIRLSCVLIAAARRWHLLYTLVRNPDLVRLRKRNLTSDMPCLTNHGLLMNMRVSSSVNGDMSLLTATSSLSVTSSQKLIEQEDYGHGLNSGYKLYEDSAKA